MSLLEQIKYIDDQAVLSGNPNFVSTPQHQYISQQLQLMANSLKEYTRVNYPSIFSDPRVSDGSYVAIAFRGLEGTKIYNDYINNISQLSNDQMYAILAALTNTKCP